MPYTVDDALIVGGGDVGLLTALSLDKLAPGTDVRVVDDFQREVPQVGKSTYLDIQQILHGTLDIEEPRFISEVKPVWKASVYFRDWCDSPSFHYTFDESDSYLAPDAGDTAERNHFHYDTVTSDPAYRTRDGEMVEQRRSPWYYGSGGDLDKYEKYAYHLTTRRFNPFMRELCRERGVTLVDDEVTSVATTGTHVDSVHGESGQYEADLYVDATGFNRVVRSEQDTHFREFGFPLDRAFNTRFDRDLSDVVPATVIETGDYGWFWQIDTYDNRDVGYVFASEYVDDETAREEFQSFIADVAPGEDVPDISAEEMDTYQYTSGYYDPAWVDNCLPIGNAEGFVEPLQSTALTANASLAVELAELLGSNDRVVDESLQSTYNDSVSETWETIYDFIAIHYLYSSGDTAFWEAASSIEVNSRVERVIDLFDEAGFDPRSLTEHDDSLSEFAVFNVLDFYTVMRKMGATSEFHERTDIDVSDAYRREVEEYYQTVSQEVEDYHLDIDEFYIGVLGAAQLSG